MVDMTGKVAIVTGGTRGIGRSIAERLAALGADVAVGARNEGDLREAEASLCERKEGRRGWGRALGVRCDVRSPEDCTRLIEKTVATFGRLDVLINNAGIGRFAHVADLSIADWDATLQTNLSGVFYCCRAAISHLRRSGDAWIINIGSLAGKNAFPNGAAYNASKFGLIGFSEALMQEIRYDDIRVSYIMPGSVATEFQSSWAQHDQSWKIQPQDIADIVENLLAQPKRSHVSRVEVRPSQPRRSD